MKLINEQDIWRDDIICEMKELASLGIKIPKKAYQLAEQALIEDYLSMDNTETIDHLIMLSKI